MYNQYQIKISKKLKVLACLVISPVIFSFSQAQDAEMGSEVLGKVGNAEFTVKDIKMGMEGLSAREIDALSRDPAAMNQFVRSLLVQRLVLREAMAEEWDKSVQVAERMKKLRDGVVATTYMESKSIPPESFPNDAEVTAAYESNKEALLIPKTWKLAQIFIADAKDGKDSTKAKEKLEKIKVELAKDKADFAAVAKAESEESASAAKGGEIGWLAENQIQPMIREALPKISEGKHSEPIQLEDGWHIIKVLETKDAYTPTLEQIRPQLIQQMRAEKARAESQAFLAKLLQENPIAINEMMLPKLLDAPSQEK